MLTYVLEGTVITKISGQGEEKTYTAGQMFYEQPGATHEVSKNASQTQPAKLHGRASQVESANRSWLALHF